MKSELKRRRYESFMKYLKMLISEQMELMSKIKILSEDEKYKLYLTEGVVITPDGDTIHVNLHGRALEYYPIIYNKALALFKNDEKALRNAIDLGTNKLYFFMYENGFIRSGIIMTNNKKTIYFSFSKSPSDKQVEEMFKILKENSPNEILLNLYISENVEKEKRTSYDGFIRNAYNLRNYVLNNRDEFREEFNKTKLIRIIKEEIQKML